MKAVKITVSRTYNLGDYHSTRKEGEFLLEEGDDVLEAFREASEVVDESVIQYVMEGDRVATELKKRQLDRVELEKRQS